MTAMMSSRPNSPPNQMVRPLRQCVLRCDRFLQMLEGGTYGYTRDGGSKFHGGVDLYAEVGTPCYAVYRGAVEWCRDFGDEGWGKALLTRVEFPGWTCWTLYAHLSRVDVVRGRVETGTPLGLTGITGNGDSRYPHLHFETWRTLKAGERGMREKGRFDPLYLLGALPMQPYAAEVMARQESRAHTA